MRTSTAATCGPQAAAARPACSLPARSVQPGRSSSGNAVAAAQQERRRLAARAAPGGGASSAAGAATTAAPPARERSMTEEMFRRMEEASAPGSEALGAGGATSYAALQRADAAWKAMRTRTVWGPRPQFVRESRELLGEAPQYDVIVCGGTLGIFLACSLQLQGLRVAVVERGPLAGRTQEWNVSRKELRELVELGVFSEAEAADCVSVEFNPVRVGFYGEKGAGAEVWTRDVLNLGVSPARLVAAARARFEAAGGCVLERTPLDGLTVHPDGVQLQLGGGGSGGGGGGQRLTTRLVLDAMGNASPVVQQVRWGRTPDGVCLVVGACCRGFDPAANTAGDVIFTNSHSQPAAAAGGSSSSGSSAPTNLQYFWEAFPAGSGSGTDRTTYMFTYVDADPRRPSLEALLEDYWRLMPPYQGLPSLDGITPLRILHGFFPTYRDSPLPPKFDRILQVGDASGIQSPLSFGGFGALTRHLGRLTSAVTEALEADMLGARSLALVNGYNPGLSGAWMLQRAMSIPAGQAAYREEFINRLLAENFKSMEALGDPTLKPFLQDVIQLRPLVATMAKQMLTDPLFVPQILGRVGPAAMADWLVHLAGLAVFTFLDWDVKKYVPIIDRLPPPQRYLMRRAIDAWKYGSGQDYTL